MTVDEYGVLIHAIPDAIVEGDIARAQEMIEELRAYSSQAAELMQMAMPGWKP